MAGFKSYTQTGIELHAGSPAAIDLEMKHDAYYDADMKVAIVSGKLPESVLDTMLLRRYSQMFRIGIFDRSYAVSPIAAQKDGAVARDIAEHAAVLLKNSTISFR